MLHLPEQAIEFIAGLWSAQFGESGIGLRDIGDGCLVELLLVCARAGIPDETSATGDIEPSFKKLLLEIRVPGGDLSDLTPTPNQLLFVGQRLGSEHGRFELLDVLATGG